MQVIFLSDWQMILLFFILWFVFQAGAGWFCFHLSDDHFSNDSFLYKIRDWEKSGKVYEKCFLIKRWKKYLPDGSAPFKEGYKKSHLVDFSVENLNQYLIESRRGELTHWLAIFPFWVFGLFAPFHVVWMMLVYALLINIPCILSLRYNRPRIVRLLEKKNKQH